jgi:hypothetical protein
MYDDSITTLNVKPINSSSGIDLAMTELDMQVRRFEDYVGSLDTKVAAISKPKKSAPESSMGDTPEASALAQAIMGKADILRRANNYLYEITAALDL